MRNRQTKSKNRKPRLSRTSKLAILAGIFFVGGVAVFWSGVLSPEAKLDTALLVAQASELEEKQEYRKVTELLGPHVSEFYDDTETLRLLAFSSMHSPLENNQHLANAIRLYHRISEIDSNDQDSLLQLHRLYARVGDFENSAEVGERFLDKNPDNYELSITTAEAWLECRQFVKAIKVTDVASQRFPERIRALVVRLAAMVANSADAGSIERFVRRQEKVPVELLEMALAGIQKDLRKVEVLVSSPGTLTTNNEYQKAWLAEFLETHGYYKKAQLVLEQPLGSEDAEFANLMLAYRHWQAFDLPKLEAEISKMDRERQSPMMQAEIDVLAALCQLNRANVERARKRLSQLSNSSEPIAKAWTPVLEELARESGPRGVVLVEATEAALRQFPEATYLMFYRGVGMELLNENDLATRSYQRAVELAPRWVLPRVALARIHASDGEWERALAESSMALQINPTLPSATDNALNSVLQLLAESESLKPSQSAAILDTLGWMEQAAENDKSRKLVQAIQFKVRGFWRQADGVLRSVLTSRVDLDESEFRLMSLAATQSSLRRDIRKAADRKMGVPLQALLVVGLEVFQNRGKAEFETWLESNSELTELSRDLATAMVFEKASASCSREAWQRMIKKYSDNPRVLELAASSRSLMNDFEIQKQIVELLKKSTNRHGIEWKIIQARIRLAEDPSSKNIAKIVLEMNGIIKRTPNSEKAYAVLANAYLKLGQKQKMVAVLESAIEQNVENPGFRLVLANEYFQNNSKLLAIQHAKAANQSRRATFEQRQDAIRLLRIAGARDQVALALGRELPKEITDSDRHFAMASAYVIAQAEIGRTSLASELLAKHAPNSDRWFNLWLDAAVVATTPLTVCTDWLEQAEGWLSPQKPARRLRLSAAWRRVARRTNNTIHWSNAIEILQPALRTKTSLLSAEKDGKEIEGHLLMAGMLEKVGQTESANAIYKALVENPNAKASLRAISANNLAASMIKSDHQSETAMADATRLIRKARQWNPRPEFADTLAQLLMKQQKGNRAIEELEKAGQEFGESLLIQIRLAEIAFEQQKEGTAKIALARIQMIQKSGNEPTFDQWQRIQELRRIHAIREKANTDEQ